MTHPINAPTIFAPTIFAPTIFACATAAGRAGIAVWRISGQGCAKIFQSLTGKTLPPARQAKLYTLRHPQEHPPQDHKILDQALCLFFPSPHSFTGEDVLELHTHGGRAVQNAIVEALNFISQKEPGLHLRMAEPGEFTRRAFENDKMDLTAAEAVHDLILAETEAQRLQALAQLSGGLAEIYYGWANRISQLLAHQEATIDFPDEDLPEDLLKAQKQEIEKLHNELIAHLKDARRGERLREGIHIAILGAPNAGKSSLLNALAQRDAAIVSAEAGTTRDVIEVALDLGGYPVLLADTAGLRETKNLIEQAGISRAMQQAKSADIKLILIDVSAETSSDILNLADENSILLNNKIDLLKADSVSAYQQTPIRLREDMHPDSNKDLGTPPSLDSAAKPHAQNSSIPAFSISTKTGAGITEFLNALKERIEREVKNQQTTPPLTRQRHREAVESAASSLARALNSDSELQAEDLRLALRALGRITGRVDVERILDKIFLEFCIGK